MLFISFNCFADEYNFIKTDKKIIIVMEKPFKEKIHSYLYKVEVRDWLDFCVTYKAIQIKNVMSTMYICINQKEKIILIENTTGEVVCRYDLLISVIYEKKYTIIKFNENRIEVKLKVIYQ